MATDEEVNVFVEETLLFLDQELLDLVNSQTDLQKPLASPKKRERQMIDTTTEKVRVFRRLDIQHFDEDEEDLE